MKSFTGPRKCFHDALLFESIKLIDSSQTIVECTPIEETENAGVLSLQKPPQTIPSDSPVKVVPKITQFPAKLPWPKSSFDFSPKRLSTHTVGKTGSSEIAILIKYQNCKPTSPVFALVQAQCLNRPRGASWRGLNDGTFLKFEPDHHLSCCCFFKPKYYPRLTMTIVLPLRIAVYFLRPNTRYT